MIEKQYYRLAEMAEQWGCSEEDLIHLGAQGTLQVCANIYGMASGLKRDSIEAPDVPPERPMPDGIYELEIDTLRFLEMSESDPVELHSAIKFDGRWWLTEFDPPIVITSKSLCVLHQEVMRYNAQHTSSFSLIDLLEEMTSDIASTGPLPSGGKSGIDELLKAARDYDFAAHAELIPIVYALAHYSAVAGSGGSGWFELLNTAAAAIASDEFIPTYSPNTKTPRSAYKLMVRHAPNPAEEMERLSDAASGMDLVNAYQLHEWLLSLNFPFADDYLDEVVKYSSYKDVSGTTQMSTEDDGKPVATRERETLYKIIIGMAVSIYKYDSSAKRGNAVADIVGDLERAGVPVSDDTVRKYIKEASQLLPPKSA